MSLRSAPSIPTVELNHIPGRFHALSRIPDAIVLRILCLYLNDVDNLGQLARTSRALKSVVLQYLNNKVEQLNILIEYANATERLTKIQANKTQIANHVSIINRTVGLRRSALQEVEEKRPIKKSTFARIMSFIPGTSLIAGSIPKFLAGATAKAVGEVALRTQLVPTCRGNPDYIDNVLLCGDSFQAYIMGGCDNGGVENCKYWSVIDEGHSWGCDYQICMGISQNLLDNSAKNDWNGGWLAAGGITAIIVAIALFKSFGRLSLVSLEKIVSQPFSHLFDADFQNVVAQVLEKDQHLLAHLTISQVVSELEDIERKAVRHKNRIFSSVPMQEVTAVLFHKLPSTSKKTIEDEHVITIDESKDEKRSDTLKTPLLSAMSL